MPSLYLSSVLFLPYWTALVFGAFLGDVSTRKRDLDFDGFFSTLNTDGQCYEMASSTSNMEDQHSKTPRLQYEDIHVCQDHFNSLFLKKFENETGIEVATVEWSLLRGSLPADFVIPTDDWSLDDMRVLVRYYYRVHFFISLDADLESLFEEECAKLCRPPPPYDAPFSSQMLELNTDEEGRKSALAFNLTHFGGKKPDMGQSEGSEDSEPVRKVESILIPAPTLAFTPTHQLENAQKLLADILRTKFKLHTNSPYRSIPWASCVILGLPASIDLSNAEKIRWVFENIYRFRFFTPKQYWMMNMFSRDLARLPPLELPSSAAFSHHPDPYGRLLECHYNLIYTEIKRPCLPKLANNVPFKVCAAMDNETRTKLIRSAVKFFLVRLLKDLGVNASTQERLNVIMIGVPLPTTLSTWNVWTDAQFRMFLSYYYRIRIFHTSQTNLAEKYAEEVQALPPPPIADEFTIVNSELRTGTDYAGQELRCKWNNADTAAMNSIVDDAGLSSAKFFANLLVQSANSWLKLRVFFDTIFLEKFRNEAYEIGRYDWNSQLHAGYPIDPFDYHLVYFTEYGMRLFLMYYYRIRFFRNDQKKLQEEYVQRLASLPAPPPLHFENLSDILGSHQDIQGMALQAEFNARSL